jgi:hypothetical protein
MDVLTPPKRESPRATPSRRWPIVALVVVALILCSAGTAGAAFLITGKKIKDETITGRDIRDHSLTARDIRGVVRGPTGPAGPVGPAGPAGVLVGADGPAAISGPVLRTSFSDVSARSSAEVSVSCPDGKVAVGGGGSTQFNLGRIEQSAPTALDGRGWTVGVFNRAFSSISVAAIVVCVTAH